MEDKLLNWEWTVLILGVLWALWALAAIGSFVKTIENIFDKLKGKR